MVKRIVGKLLIASLYRQLDIHLEVLGTLESSREERTR